MDHTEVQPARNPARSLLRLLLAQDAELRGQKRSQWTDSILHRSPTTRPAPTLGGSEALHIGCQVASALSAVSLGKSGKRARRGQFPEQALSPPSLPPKVDIASKPDPANSDLRRMVYSFTAWGLPALLKGAT